MTPAEKIECMDLIEELRNEDSEEDDIITISARNPDSDGPENVVVVQGEWTGYKYVHFDGPTLLSCLRQAVAARRK